MTKIDLKKLKTVSLKDRYSKVSINEFAKPILRNHSTSDFVQCLPNILAAKDLRSIAEHIIRARTNNHEVIWAMGSHVLKVGLSPIIIELIKQKRITAIAFNGSSIIHDFEIAYAGNTSEDVGSGLSDGSFGVTRETALFFNEAINYGYKKKIGLGQSVGELIANQNLKYKKFSVFHAAILHKIPVTVHVALGTDVFHMHPECDGGKLGALSLRDFHVIAEVISRLNNGVFLNIGSCVILPEVFLKSLNLVRNVGGNVGNFTTANFDFIRHYRPMTNVVSRPTEQSGMGYNIIGHHELMIPMLAMMMNEL